MKTQSKKGFTIVELVIVIAVIAILAAVLIPTFINLTKKANEANAQLEAKNLITEMLANILTGKEGDADLLVFSQKDNNVYIHGYSREAGKVIAYHDSPKAIPSGTEFETYVAETLLKEMTDNAAIRVVPNLEADDWRHPDNMKNVDLDAKTDKILIYANYTIAPLAFQYPNKFTVNGVAYETPNEAIAAAKDGDTITLYRNEAFKFTTTKETTLKNITFKAAEGVKIKGLQLVGTKGNKLTLDNIRFEGISFTAQVVIGQDNSFYGRSQCSNIVFENCDFDLSESTAEYKDAIKRGAPSVSENISEKEDVAYLKDITIRNCTFKNTRYGAFLGMARNVTVENCKFTNSDLYAVRINDAAGDIVMNNNTADRTGGFLRIGTVGNNYSTTKPATTIIITNNIATNMTCPDKEVFCANYDEVNRDTAANTSKAAYTIVGNTVSYTNSNFTSIGFWIKTTFNSSVQEFIEQGK